MKLILTPQEERHLPIYERYGDKLIIDGEEFDFTELPEGGIIHRGNGEELSDPIQSEMIIGPVRRKDGVLLINILLGYSYPGEMFQRFPEPIIDPPDGIIDIPVDTIVTEKRVILEDGRTEIKTTTVRWHQEPEIVVTYEDNYSVTGEENAL